MAHHTTKEDLIKWVDEIQQGGQIESATVAELINLIRDASQLHDLDEIYEYTKQQEDPSVEDCKVMIAHCATDCADKDYDIAKLEKEVSDLKKQITELEADKPN